MDAKWVQISQEAESWHIVKYWVEIDDSKQVTTVCGLNITTNDVRDERPPNDKTCENCFRIWELD